MQNQKISGYIMEFIGFLILLINAMGYLFNLDIKHPALIILGLVFVVVGMNTIRKAKSKNGKIKHE